MKMEKFHENSARFWKTANHIIFGIRLVPKHVITHLPSLFGHFSSKCVHLILPRLISGQGVHLVIEKARIRTPPETDVILNFDIWLQNSKSNSWCPVAYIVSDEEI
uniref:Uncharacterized protein n=1 Tax=Cacopsylla melanoneura TaxID=428564 RepID=A0A8D9C186_9HEMI